MQRSRLGGSSDSDDMAVAVIPIGSPPTQTVMTFTVEATRRIACLKSRVRAEASVAMAPANGREESLWQWPGLEQPLPQSAGEGFGRPEASARPVA